MDVKNSFLNGKLEDKAYMCPSLGYTCSTNKVCCLCNALYGLKQAPWSWFTKFHNTISQMDLSYSAHNSTLFTRKTNNGTIFLLLYVNDMIITSDDSTKNEKIKQFICQHFEMKDIVPFI